MCLRSRASFRNTCELLVPELRALMPGKPVAVVGVDRMTHPRAAAATAEPAAPALWALAAAWAAQTGSTAYTEWSPAGNPAALADGMTLPSTQAGNHHPASPSTSSTNAVPTVRSSATVTAASDAGGVFSPQAIIM